MTHLEELPTDEEEACNGESDTDVVGGVYAVVGEEVDAEAGIAHGGDGDENEGERECP